MRTQKFEGSTKHLSNSRTLFLKLLEVVRNLKQKTVDELIAARDYEELDLLIVNALMGQS
jgi:xylose isomerase